jgi:chromosome segregation ATPase
MQTATDITRLNQIDRNGYLEGHITSLETFIFGWQAALSANNNRVVPTQARLERALERRAMLEGASPQNQNHIKDAVSEVSNCTSLLSELADMGMTYTARIAKASRDIENFRSQIVA